MTLSKQPHYAQVHCVPDDYKFTSAELKCIINGDMFTPRQAAIMARELLERRERDKQEPVGYIVQDKYERQNDQPGHLSLSHVSKYVSDEDISEHEITCTPLYTAPPVPVVPDERASYESFVEQRLGDCVNRRRAKNGDQEYMAWDMAMGWIVWQGRAAMLQSFGNSEQLEPVSQPYKLVGEVVAWDHPTKERSVDFRWLNYDVAPGTKLYAMGKE